MRLDWPDNSVQSANTVVYANFSRDENWSTRTNDFWRGRPCWFDHAGVWPQ
jgi:hypothetical protein